MQNLPEKIDLHMHTVVSDGTDTAAELIEVVKANNINMFSVTDHDTIEGCRMIRKQLQDNDSGLIFLNGVEFSTRDEDGRYHILGYGYDENSPYINDMAYVSHNIRMKKLTERLDFLKDVFSMEFTHSEVSHLEALSNPGKPHIGELMVEKGYADSVDDAINNYLNKRKASEEYVRPEEAIEAIVKSGGVPVLAHPSFGDGNQRITGDDMDARLHKLIGYGLKGVEAYYSEFTKELTEEILGFSKKYDLYVTAGSDYHGKNKKVEIGNTGLGSTKDGGEGLLAFLERVL